MKTFKLKKKAATTQLRPVILQANLGDKEGRPLASNNPNTQSWTALFRAFSSHRQPSASLTKLFPSWTKSIGA